MHDIRSPLAALQMMVMCCEGKLNEKERIAMRDATIRINDIANNLLNRYEETDT